MEQKHLLHSKTIFYKKSLKIHLKFPEIMFGFEGRFFVDVVSLKIHLLFFIYLPKQNFLKISFTIFSVTFFPVISPKSSSDCFI